MLQDLNQRLAEAATRMAREEKLSRRAQELHQEYQRLSATVDEQRQQVRKEDGDVDRLEKSSLAGLFYSFLGSRDEQLHKERQEALAAHLKLDEATKRLEALGRDYQQANSDLHAARGAEAEYRRLLAEKEAYISSSGEGARELFQIGERENGLNWQAQQLQEAIAAGQSADGWLARVENSLGSAQGWGTWDMLGGGLIATMAKHSRMDEAKQDAYHAQQALAAFRRELKDVQASLQVDDIQLDGFTRFADFFFDGLIVDWVVQSRINQSLDSVRRARYEVSSLLHMLQRQLNQVGAEGAALQQERARFIERYGM